MRKTYTAAFKVKLVQELLKENKSLSQLASEHKVHPTQLRQAHAVRMLVAGRGFDDDADRADGQQRFACGVFDFYARHDLRADRQDQIRHTSSPHCTLHTTHYTLITGRIPSVINVQCEMCKVQCSIL